MTGLQLHIFYIGLAKRFDGRNVSAANRIFRAVNRLSGGCACDCTVRHCSRCAVLHAACAKGSKDHSAGDLWAVGTQFNLTFG
jgi:hypothetical protein